MAFSYKEHKDRLIKNFPENYKLVRQHNWDEESFEPYYPFFLWLAANAKLSTVCSNQDNKEMLIHTWYSREYGVDDYHTKRIDKVINECYEAQEKMMRVSNLDYFVHNIDQKNKR